MILHQHVGKSESPGVFEIKCSFCDRVYVQFAVTDQSEMSYEFQCPVVPCHADALNVGSPAEDPWVRVNRLLNPDKKKEPKDGAHFEYMVTMLDGMIYRVTIRRLQK